MIRLPASGVVSTETLKHPFTERHDFVKAVKKF
jgi:hypothetical protein